MAQVVNTNILSLNAQRNLNSSQGALATSLERLSSGLRINSAKDDAAGLAISERFTTQIRGLSQAVRNANDGISFAQTAEGALSTVGDALQRIRELAVQSANDTNSASDRQALNNEAQALIAEIGRVASATEFNGGKILDGSVKDLFFQIGANQGQNIAVSGVDARTMELGRAVLTGTEGLSQDAIKVGIESITNMTITVNDVDIAVPLSEEGEFAGVFNLEDMVRAINVAISNFESAETDPADAASENAAVRNAGLTASLITDNAGNTTISLQAARGADISVTGGVATLNEEVGGETAVDFFNAADNEAEVQQLNLTNVDIGTRFGAGEALAVVDGALTQVNSLRAELGAVQIRFESTISNLSVSVENLSAARSRIRDADFAAETAELTRSQILQQAGISVLAQANATPQSVLALLQ
jgi:flagellin